MEGPKIYRSGDGFISDERVTKAAKIFNLKEKNNEDEDEEDEEDEQVVKAKKAEVFKKRAEEAAKAFDDIEEFEMASPDTQAQFERLDYNFIDLLDLEKYGAPGTQGERHGAQQRPAAAFVNDEEEDFEFMHVETTYGCTSDDRPEIRLFGVNAAGNSVCVRVDWFQPYFFAAINSDESMNSIRWKLEKFLRAKKPNAPHERFVLKVEKVQGRSLYGFHCNRPLNVMFKITMAMPSYVPMARDCLEDKNEAVTFVPIPTYEANVPFELRFMIDAKFGGCQWLKLNRRMYVTQTDVGRISNAQYEFYARPGGCITPIDTKQKGTLAPLRTVSFDIEACREERGFVNAKENSAICIAAALHELGKGIIHSVFFALKPQVRERTGQNPSYIPLPGATCYLYESEEDMLMAFRQYICEIDADCFTGWNISNFDLPYLMDRAHALKIADLYASMTRINGKRAWIRKQTYTSKALGSKTSCEQLCEGRFDFDGLRFMERMVMFKFRSYKLDHIAKKTTGERKDDVHYSQIPILYYGSDADRTRLFAYCLRDALLPLRILEKQMGWVNCIEQARVTGVPIKWLLSRGQGVKTFSSFLREKEHFEHPPSRSPKSQMTYTAGGYVKDPLRGYWKFPLASLDFASLYPSIMIAYNICYSTAVTVKWARANLKPGDYVIPPPAVDAKGDAERLCAELDGRRGQAEREDKSNLKRSWFEPGVASQFAQGVNAPKRAKKKTKAEERKEEIEDSEAGKEPEYCFVKAHIREGILPRLLKGVLQARSDVKNMMKTHPKDDKIGLSVLDSRQLALKVVANSVYGFVKAFILRFKELMSAVTSFGRHMIFTVNRIINTEFQGIDVVDVPECVRRGIDPEDESNPNCPRTKTNAFVVYGDTDSVMVCFGDVTLADCCKYGALAAKRCTEACREAAGGHPVISLVFEAVKLVSIYLMKKRYAALQIEKIIPGERLADAMKRADLVIKGMEGKRRDNAKIGSKLQKRVLEPLLREKNIEKAEKLVYDTIEDLQLDRIDMSQLVISKGLSKTDEAYAAGGSKQMHVELKKRIEARAHITGETPPKTGDRVEFVIVAGTKDSKVSELAEDPLYALKNNVPINTEYYLNKQIWPAIIRIFTAVYEPEKCSTIKSTMGKKARMELKAHRKFFSADAPHMLRKKMRRTTGYGISSETQVLPQCVGCGQLLKFNVPTCGNCNADNVYEDLKVKMVAAQDKKTVAWEICRACQGDAYGKVECAATTCKNFFHRQQTIRDIEDLSIDLKRF